MLLEAHGFTDEIDKQALFEFKSQVSENKRAILSSWNNSFPLCSWKGVTCGRKHKKSYWFGPWRIAIGRSDITFSWYMPPKPNTGKKPTGPVVKLTNQELGQLERDNKKTAKSAKMVNPIILRPDEAGVLRNQEGHVCNEQGQKLDAEGQFIQEELVVADKNARCVDQRNDGIDRRNQEGIDRRNIDVDRRNARAGANGADLDGNNQQNFQARWDNNGEFVKTLADFNRPDLFYENRSTIIPPPFPRNDFELKPTYFALVGQRPFQNLPHEKPLDHIEHFEDIVTSIKANVVTEDYLYCKLFPYSLAGEASHWLLLIVYFIISVIVSQVRQKWS
ncbi:PREDICTED: uncharacterized protein LOC104783865 [Camelina sativa]|uniref:Uncharacterized protein LOC104783865 n=1 Tax=Camelina sativa TaxID=90675 RepID=A0ABM0YX79_CAMSA|nr:PREDICTED: uncharacterized protein LOC104783865 [Camelina sativa]